MTPCKFYFGDDPTWDGLTDGSTWNGFNNVWVTEETHKAIVQHFTREYRVSGYHGADLLEVMDSFFIEPDDDGLYSYANGFATSIEE